MKQKHLLLLLTFVFISVSTVFAQQPTRVTGAVLSADDGQPVIGATVLVKGSKIGTITNVSGAFTLNNLPPGARTLVVSYIGMETQEVPVASQVRVLLKPQFTHLGEVVVTVAYGSAKKSSLTGAISTVSSKQLELRPVSTVTSAIEGTTSGVQMGRTMGVPGASPVIRIRGIGTVNGSSSPLYVLDGIPFEGNISDLNPADIESISVLKDAASSALYGNRAANGVILITTKQGKAGKMTLDLKVNQGIYSRGVPEYDRADPRLFMNLYWQNLHNFHRYSKGLTEAEAVKKVNQEIIPDYLYLNIFNKPDDQLFDASGQLLPDAQILPLYQEDLDWYKHAIRSGHRQEYLLSAGGSSNVSAYYLSVGYLNEKGYVTNSDFDRLSANLSASFSPKKWIKVGATLNASHQNMSNTSGTDSKNLGNFTNAFGFCRNIAPIYPVYLHNADGTYALDENGNKQYDPGTQTLPDGTGGSTLRKTRNQYIDRHLVWENELNSDQTVRNTLNATAYTDISLPYDFTLSLKGNLGARNTDNNRYTNATIGDGKPAGGRISKSVNRWLNYTVQQQLRWNHDFGPHNVDLLIGHENYAYNSYSLYGFKQKEAVPFNPSLDNFSEINTLDGAPSYYRTESYLGRIRYNYQERYNVEASFRRDGSSRFHPKSRWGNFGSVGANWLISREEFMKPYSWVNMLKLRANYGQVGNDAGSGYYAYRTLYTSDVYNSDGAYYKSQIEAPDLHWETSEAYGIALEGRLFDRWNFTLEYFDKRNRDLIFDVYQPLSAGATSTSYAEATLAQNIGTISNRGIEISTDVDIFRNKDWTINVGTNASFIKNIVTKLPDQNKEGIESGTRKIVEGRSRYEFYTYTFQGVDQLTGRSLYKPNLKDYYYLDAQQKRFGAEQGGSDITKEVVLIGGVPYVTNPTYAAKEFHGSALPKVFGSFNTNISYKGITLSALFTYQLGGVLMDGIYMGLMSVGSKPYAMHADLANSWNGVPKGITEDSPNRILKDGIPQINYDQSSDNNRASSRFLISSDYLTVKNISLSYDLPKPWVKRLDLSRISFNVSCENLFSFTARRGLEPQQSLSGGQDNYLVTPRVFIAGLSIQL